MTPGKGPFKKLPVEVVNAIAAYLDPKEVATLQLVSKTLKAKTQYAQDINKAVHDLTALKDHVKHLEEKWKKKETSIKEGIEFAQHGFDPDKGWIDALKQKAQSITQIIGQLEQELVNAKKGPLAGNPKVKPLLEECEREVTKLQQLFSRIDHGIIELAKFH
jgi:hypothetical protein